MAKYGFIISLILCYLSTNASCFMFDNFFHFMSGMHHVMFGDITTPKSTYQTTSNPIAMFTATHPTYSLSCYSCSGLPRDGRCSTQWLCKPGEVCAVFFDGHGYTHKCIEKKVCSTARSVHISGCWKCCDTDLCNDRCNTTAENQCGTESPKCAILQAEGYDVCADHSVAHHECRKTCGLC